MSGPRLMVHCLVGLSEQKKKQGIYLYYIYFTRMSIMMETSIGSTLKPSAHHWGGPFPILESLSSSIK